MSEQTWFVIAIIAYLMAMLAIGVIPKFRNMTTTSLAAEACHHSSQRYQLEPQIFPAGC